MKKTFTLFLLGLGFGLSAQSFSVYKTNNSQTVNTATITNGYVISDVTTASTPTAQSVASFKIKLVNNTASTATLSVLRKVVYQNPALLLDGAGNMPDTYFCFGFNCFPSTVNSPSAADYCVLGASGSTVSPFDNSKDNGTPFIVYIVEGLTQGKYFVNYKVFDINNPTDSVSFTVKYNEFQGVEESPNIIESVGNLYPNPTTNNAQFSLVLKQESAVKVEVFNSLGALVYNSTEQKLAGKNKLSLDCSNFNSGLYFVTVTSGESKITKRLVINK